MRCIYSLYNELYNEPAAKHFHVPVEIKPAITIVWPRNNDLIALRDTVSFGFVMSLRSHLFFERDNANLAREKSMQN